MEELLRNAAARGDSEQVFRLLAQGTKNSQDENGRNALHLAAVGGYEDVVAALLVAKWDVNSQDAAGCTALQRAAAEGHVGVVKQLIRHGANVNIQDKMHGNTALHEASWKGYSKCVEAICGANRVNLQVKNVGGFAPLHLACQNGHNQSCRELLMANCDPDVQNNYGDTPLHTSARYGHAGVTRILISADCHMSDQNKNGDTALHIAAAMGRRKLTRILLEAGCDPHRTNKQNEKARDIAVRKDLVEIIQIIDKTVPVKQKERRKEKTNKEKGGKENEKKREKIESGSSKDSSTRLKDKKKPKNEQEVYFQKMVEAKWSPYGCHYYPDSKTFPKPKLDSLPHEPLKKGEQYYLDLAGNIRKGPVGVGYTCYCAPFFRHMEERLDRDKQELKEHIDAAQNRLDKKVTSLEIKTRTQLNEITRSMALERAKCQQRHIHLEQWLIRGSIFRNSEKARASECPVTPLPKSKSLENILSKKPVSRDFRHKSVDVLNDQREVDKDVHDDLKNRSSSREGKESGKGSSEIGDLGTSESEDKVDGDYSFSKRMMKQGSEPRMRLSALEMSERIDEAAKNGEKTDGLGVLYDEMIKWKSYHNTFHKRNFFDGRRNDKENQRDNTEKLNLPQVRIRRTKNRHSYHDLLNGKENDKDLQTEWERARLSEPRVSVEEPERKSVQEIVAKLQKQHTVHELVAKIQKKTGLIHKSAKKLKDGKVKSKKKGSKHSTDNKNGERSQGVESNEEENVKQSHNYENLGSWEDPQEKISQLPYRCRDTVYSPSPNPYSYTSQECQRDLCEPNTGHDFCDDRPILKHESKRSISDLSHPKNLHRPNPELLRKIKLYECENPAGESCRRETTRESQPLVSCSNDSGYSTKPYGGSSTGPSPTLSGQDFDYGITTEIKSSQQSLSKPLQGPTSSLV